MLKGTFDGTKYEDLRVLIPESIKHYYMKRREWDLIVKYRSYENSESITIRKKDMVIKHTWKLVNGIWDITKDEME